MSITTDRAIEAVNAIADILGIPPSADVHHCAVCVILNLWNYTREKTKDGEFDAGTYGKWVGAIFSMIDREADGICISTLHRACLAVQAIRMELYEDYKREREARIESIRQAAREHALVS